jgi:tRNA G18 (ribose-2'-O)-methylase SpoU
MTDGPHETRLPVRIDNAQDPRLSPYRDIKERDLIGRQGRFIAEGKVVLNLLVESRFETESVLVLENRLPGLEGIVRRLPDAVPVYVASRDVLDAVAGFPVHRGVLAIGRRPRGDAASDLLAGCAAPATVLALVGISNHDNMGAIFRNAAAFGVAAVLLDSTCCDPLYRKSIRVSVGAVLKVPFARAGRHDDLLRLLQDGGWQPLALSPRAGFDIAALTHPGRMAILLGTEGEGLPADLLRKVRTARIAMAAGLDSLNVATAGAIALHHFYGTMGGTAASVP